jgi:hypothetical protein
MKILGTTLNYNGVDATTTGTAPSSLSIRDENAHLIAVRLRADAIGSRTSGNTITSYAHIYALGFTITASTFSTTSDIRLKEVLGNITNATNKLCLLTPFKYKHSKLALEMYSNNESINNNDRYGLSAQELQVVFPEVVSDKFIKDAHGNKYLSVAYSELIPVLVQSIKELNERITSLEGVISSK